MTSPVTPALSREHLDLVERILAGGRIEHQDDVVRRLGVQPPEHAAHLGQFVHQMRLVLQSPSGVDDQRVDAGRGRLLDAVEDDTGRVAAFLAADHRRADAVAPDLQLLDRRGAKGVARRQQDAIILLLQQMAELADGGRLAAAVDPDHQDDVRPRKAPDVERLGDRRQDLLDLLGQDGAQPALVELLEAPRGNRFADPLRRFGPEIGCDQRFLDIVEGRRVERLPWSQAR